MRFSIVVPVLNEAPIIEAALARLQVFRERGASVIVADGGSADGTARLAAPLADVIVTAPRGRGAQMNAGAGMRDADVYVFLHADTILPDNALGAIEMALARTGRRWGRFDVRIGSARLSLKLVGAMMNLRSRLTGIATGDQAMFVTRGALAESGGIPDIALMEDIAFSKALKALGPPACLSDKVVTSARRWETHGVVRTVIQMWRLRLRFFLGADPDALAREYGYTPRDA